MESIVSTTKPLQDLNNKIQHVVSFFSDLQFDAEQHIYKHKERQLRSVSSVIKSFVVPFDADRIAGYVAKSRGCDKEDVLQEWEDKKNAACDKGNRVHEFGENYKKGDSPTDGHEAAVVAFWDSVPPHIVPFTMELKMFSKKLGVAGTADIILYNTLTGKFTIADYKTNIDLFKNYRGKKMLMPFNDMLDSPYSKYEVQLSFYQLLFEQCGFEVEDRIVIWLKPDGSFEKYRTSNLIDTIKTIV